MKQRARVMKTEGEYAWVVLKKTSSCGDNCMTCGLCDMDKTRTVRVYNGGVAAEGEEVEVVLRSKKALALAGITYTVPLLLFFSAALLWNRAWVALLALLGGFFVCACLANCLSKTRAFMSYIRRRDGEDG